MPVIWVMRLFDPCCGEGAALAELGHRLSYEASVPERNMSCHTYGVEIDAERAGHARELLSNVIHNDINDCFVGRQQFSVLFLNPPYGETVSDKASISGAKTERLEQRFFKDTVNSLVFGGILILIIPAYSLDKAFANRLIRHFDQLRVYRAQTDQFKQVVVMGVKKRVSDRVSSAEINDIVTKGKDWTDVNPFPRTPDATYLVPSAPDNPKLFSMTITGELLDLEPDLNGVWPPFQTVVWTIWPNPPATANENVRLAHGTGVNVRPGERACDINGWSNVIDKRGYLQDQAIDDHTTI